VRTHYAQGVLRLEGKDDVPASVATTDASGRFALTADQSGLFTVRIAAPGKVPLTIGPFPLVEALELPPAVLPGDAGTSAVVQTAEGHPAAGLLVLAEGEGEAPDLDGWRVALRTARTAPDGAMMLPRLDGETLRMRLFSGPGVEEVRDGFQGGALRLGAAPPPERRLRVVDARGEALAGVLVSFGEAYWPAGLTAADGRMSFRGDGTIRVRLLSPDGRQAAGRLAMPPHGKGRPEDETLILGDGFAVTGRVMTDVGGQPLPDALVWCSADPGGFLRTDAAGRYATRLMAAGSVWLQAQASGRLSGRIALTDSQLRAGRVPAFALERAASVAGRVVDATGAPLSGAWVRAVPVPRNDTPSSTQGKQPTLAGAASAADGSFRLGPLKPGEIFVLQASLPGFLLSTAQALTPPTGRRAGPPVRLVLAPARAAFGRVQDTGHRPIPGAAVRLSGTAGGNGSRAISDSQGRFTVAEVPAMGLDLSVSKPGFAPAVVRNFKVRGGAGPIDLGSITLRPGAAVTGLVGNPQGKPVAGARVFLVEDVRLPFALAERLRGETPDGTTGADGRFSLADLPPGLPVHLLISAPGHLPVTVRGIRPPTTAPLQIRLETGSTFIGRVLDPAGLPVPRAEVEVTWQATLPGLPHIPTGPPVSKSTRAGRDGRFEIGELPAGAATLGVSAAGFVAAEEIRVALPQAPGEEKTIVLERGTTLQGRVETTAGEPVPGARVIAGSATGISDSEGLFDLDAVLAGQVLVEVRHPHYKPFQRQVHIEEGINHLDVVFEAGREVRGRVIDHAGAPVSGAEILLAAAARHDGRSYTARSDFDGQFVLASVATGSYRLRASAQGFADEELPQTVTVEREALRGIDVVLQPGGAITGRLLGLQTAERSRVTVRAEQEGSEPKTAEIDAAGSYVLRNLRAGDWLLRASLDGGQRQVQARVPLPEGGEETRDLKFGEHLTLSGLVLYRDQPLANASISLRGEHLAVERSVVTDHQGLFRFEELDADTYLLGLTHVRELLTHNQPVELTENRAVTIRLERSIVAGTVTEAAHSEPLANALVDLRHPAGEDGPEFLLGGSSDEAGSFRFERVPPGRYRMSVRREGYAPVDQPLEVTAGIDLTGLEVPLQPTQGTELSVRLASGRIPALLHLRLQSPDGAPVLMETRSIGSDGTVRLSTAPPGSWLLLAASTDGALTSIPLQVPGERTDLILPDAARLSVRIPSLSGSDALAILKVATANGQPLQILGPGGSFTQQWTLVAGKATIEGVPAGNWIVSAMAPDGHTWTAEAVTNGRSDVLVNLN
jgi:protocatechuate 3,4-dioxygenase beta subunit